MAYVLDTDHVERGLSRLTGLCEEAPRMTELLRIFLEQCQQIDNTLSSIYSARMLATATASHLDTIGRIVQEPRRGRTDTQYRAAILLRAAVRRSRGRAADIQAVIAAAETLPYHIYRPGFGPAAYSVIFDDARVVPSIEREVAGAVRQATAAGVQVAVIYPVRTSGVPGTPPLNPFVLRHIGSINVPTRGLSDASNPPGPGGPLSYVALP